MAARPPAERRSTRGYRAQLVVRPDVLVAELAAGEWGSLSVGELLACGLSHDGIRRRVQGGRLHPMFRGVYAVGHAGVPMEGRFLGAVKACGRAAALSHISAGMLWEMLDREERRLEVTVLGQGTRRHPGIRVHRTCVLAPVDLRTHKGIRVTSPARTLVDIAPLLEYRGLRRAVRRAQGMGLVSHGQLVEAINRLGPRRGSRNLRRLIATGPAPTRSELEDVVLDLILRGGLAHPDVNRPLRIEGRRIVPDFRWSDQRLVIEADGAAWHDTQVAREDDAERQALLEAHGERVLRVTWEQAVAKPGQTVARLRAAGAPLAASSDD